jgi:hypothetical protein
MTQRTPEEILARIEQIKADDFFGFQTTDLVSFLPYESALPFLQDGVTEADWKPRTDPVQQIKDYAEFAWDKANNRRGLSASRSVEHMKAWLWLDGKDELAERMDSVYEYYGKPCLVLVCREYGIDWRALDDGEWSNGEYEQNLTADEVLKQKGLDA